MLSTDQLQAIDRHLRKDNWLVNEELIAELKDHYAEDIEERVTNGIQFEAVIQEIHNGFGGRKGLRKMEEEFQKAQAQNNGRIIRQKIASYFRLPRLVITCLLLLLVYYNTQTLANGLTLIWNTSWLLAGLVVGVIILNAMLYGMAFFQLIQEFQQPSQAKAFSNELRILLQVITSFMNLSIFVRIWLPIEQILLRYPFISSIIITGFILIELATTELLWDRLYRKNRPKLA
ncbi:hypothetical protein [Spirosoma aerolatum]|uniref:hypothetical protein n=1 Tax=Spirosoma aerolatum TaxID=1211326 RepID=UPI0009ABAB04|nr:hypothetical protein [Spirosoma aerolatum]